ncbi:GPI inositol deacylase [Tieghemiomyces parasiticus]|uniref:GPI inositol-deacylase n=1 Tax=Tieghemiomyces parasiticus TaxID=78921 RepID=A0A9W8ABK6_9FUNG|nr:GPI inositol deacylase [Tieghemiomyces parasiticus]
MASPPADDDAINMDPTSALITSSAIQRHLRRRRPFSRGLRAPARPTMQKPAPDCHGTALAPSLSRRRYNDDDSPSSDTLTLAGGETVGPAGLAAAGSHRAASPARRPRFGCTRLLILLATFAVALLGLMLHAFFRGQADPQGCDMFYMYPVYYRQNGLDITQTRFAHKYSLYLYREGGVDELLAEPFRIPVLFIPGNAGSYKQVRSIAAVTSRQYAATRQQFAEAAFDDGNIGFDFFTLDLNEEFTALHGYSLREQAEFVNDAVRYILSRYPTTRDRYRSHLDLRGNDDLPWVPPASVILLGHSMGGVVARTAVTLSNYHPGSVNTILTLSSPHLSPPAALESYVDNLYRTTNEFWIREFNRPVSESLLDDMALVSIAGGNLDAMVGSDLAFVDTSVPPNHGFTVFTTQIPGVWLSMDHQSILWCKQMVEVVGRALMAVVDARRPGQTKPLTRRMYELRRWLVTDPDSLRTETAWARLAAPSGPVWDTVLRPANDPFPGHLPVETSAWNATQLRLAWSPRPTVHLLTTNRAGLITANGPTTPTGWETFSGRSLGSSDADVLLCRAADRLALDQALRAAEGLTSWYNLRSLLTTCYSTALGASRIPAFAVPEPNPQRRPTYNFLSLPVELVADFDAVLVYYGASPLPYNPTRHLDFLLARRIDDETPMHDGPTAATSTASPTSPPAGAVHRLSVGVVELLTSLVRPLAFNVGSAGAALRTVVHLDIPDNPLYAYWLHIQPRPSTLANPAFPPILFQSDATHSEGRFWFNISRAHLDFHRRGPYVPAELLAGDRRPADSTVGPAIEGSPHRWPGLQLTLFADPSAVDGYDLELTLDVYGTVARLFKRYELVLLGFVMIYTLFAWKLQWKSWNRERRYVSFPAALNRFVRSRFLLFNAGLMGLSFLQSCLLDHLATYRSNWVVTDAIPAGDAVLQSPQGSEGAWWLTFRAFAWISNAFLGHRGDGTWLLLVAMSACALGTLVMGWVLLDGAIHVLAFVILFARQRLQATARRWPHLMGRRWIRLGPRSGTLVWPRASVDILNRYNLFFLPESSDIPPHLAASSVPLMRRRSAFASSYRVNTTFRTYRKALTVVILLVAVATFVPYQFAFCSLWAYHLITCIKTQITCQIFQQARNPTPGGHSTKERTSAEYPTVSSTNSHPLTPSTAGTAVDAQALRDHLAAAVAATPSGAKETHHRRSPSTPASTLDDLPVVRDGDHNDFAHVIHRQYDYQLTVLIFMMLLLPYNMPEIVVWMRNLAVNWTEDAASDHNVFWLGPFLILTTFSGAFILPYLPMAGPSGDGGGTGILGTSLAGSAWAKVSQSHQGTWSDTDLRSVLSGTPSEFLSPTPSPPITPHSATTLLPDFHQDLRLASPTSVHASVASPSTAMPTPGLLHSPWFASVTDWGFNVYISLILVLGFQRAYLMYTWGTLFASWIALLYIIESGAFFEVLRIARYYVGRRKAM